MRKEIENNSDFEGQQDNIIELGVASIETKGKTNKRWPEAYGGTYKSIDDRDDE